MSNEKRDKNTLVIGTGTSAALGAGLGMNLAPKLDNHNMKLTDAEQSKFRAILDQMDADKDYREALQEEELLRSKAEPLRFHGPLDKVYDNMGVHSNLTNAWIKKNNAEANMSMARARAVIAQDEIDSVIRGMRTKGGIIGGTLGAGLGLGLAGVGVAAMHGVDAVRNHFADDAEIKDASEIDYISSLIKEAMATQERKGLSEEQFAFPEQRKFPIHDPKHVRLAWAYVDKSNLSDADKAKVRKNIMAQAQNFDMDTSHWKTAEEEIVSGIIKSAGNMFLG